MDTPPAKSEGVNDPARLVLAFPPLSMPTSPPLGICALKGYVERNVPGWSVRTIDLNLATYSKIFKFISRGRYFDRRRFREGLLGEIALSRAAETFSGAHNDEFYGRPDRYTVYGDLFLKLGLYELAGLRILENAYKNDSSPGPLVEEYAELLLAEKPDAVGLSICYWQQAWMGLCIAREIKRRASVPVIFGGTFFQVDTDTFLSNHSSAVDFIVTGEGELALGRLLQSLGDPSRAPGVTYMSADGPKSNPPEFDKDLDSLGRPDFSDLDLDAYYSPEPVVPVLTSRGCYWRKCAFCVHYKSAGQTYRTYSVEHVVEEMKSHVDAGVTHFSLVDEMISPKRFGQLADGIMEAGLDIRYYALAKPVKQFTQPLLEKMYASGCRYLLWGMESASQRVLDLMRKGTEVETMRKVFHTARDVGLINHVFVMPGFPTENREEFLQTMRFLAEEKDVIYGVHRGLFQLMKGSPVFDDADGFHITQIRPAGDPINKGWYEFECSRGMKRKEAQEAYARALPFMSSFCVYSITLGHFRDHALLIYSQPEARLNPGARQFPAYQA